MKRSFCVFAALLLLVLLVGVSPATVLAQGPTPPVSPNDFGIKPGENATGIDVPTTTVAVTAAGIVLFPNGLNQEQACQSFYQHVSDRRPELLPTIIQGIEQIALRGADIFVMGAARGIAKISIGKTILVFIFGEGVNPTSFDVSASKLSQLLSQGNMKRMTPTHPDLMNYFRCLKQFAPVTVPAESSLKQPQPIPEGQTVQQPAPPSSNQVQSASKQAADSSMYIFLGIAVVVVLGGVAFKAVAA